MCFTISRYILQLVCIAVCLLFFSGSTAQPKTDSLEQLLQRIIDSEERLELQLQLLEVYAHSNPERALELLGILESKIDETRPEAFIRFQIAKGYYYRKIAGFEEGLEAAFLALQYARKSPDSIRHMARIYNILGTIADDNSDVKSAIENQLIALRYSETIQDEPLIAEVSGSLGRAYLYLEDYDSAERHCLKAIAIKERLKEFDVHLGNYYSNLSSCYDGKENFELSLAYLDKSIALKKEGKWYADLISSYNNKAYTLFLMGRLDQAEASVLDALKLGDSLNWESELMYAHSTYAEILFAQNKVQKAEEHMARSIAFSEKYNDLYLAKYNYDLLYNIHLKKGDYKQALEHYRKRSVIVDSVNSANARREIEKLSLEYETEKKNREIEQLNTEKELSNIALDKSQQLQIVFLVAAVLAVVVILLLWSRHKNKAKTDKLLKEAMKQEFERKLADTEMQALRAQMNPHFLFNSLNSINSFIIKNDQEKASEYLSKFSKLIRKVLGNSKTSLIPLSDELETLKLYIELEKLRFGDQFTYSISVAPEMETDYVEVPPMIIQPYVENSIWHGLMHKTDGPGHLDIRISRQDGKLCYMIEDDGIGREAAEALKSKTASKRKSFGMSITRDRLRYNNVLQDETNGIEIIDLVDPQGDPCGTRVVLTLDL